MPALSLISRLSFLAVLLLSLASFSDAARENDTDLFHFVTRPDLKPPKWNIKVYDQANLLPGYWFLAPYRSPHTEEEGDGWIGPTIYDSDGELVWSGATEYGNRDIYDFRINHMRGEPLLTFLHTNEKAAFILNSNFTVRDKLREVANDAGQVDLHEFSFGEDGAEAVAIKTEIGEGAPDCLEAKGPGQCVGVHYDGFKALDTNTWEEKFSWSAKDHIDLDETTAGGWDYVHANSVDKTSEGNYLFSSRHTDTIYHIDGKTGEILWRLGGKKSDFTLGKDVKFSRQHDIRWRGSDGRQYGESKMWISMLDNAKGEDPREPTREMSRGLRLVLDTRQMTAEVDLQIDHPEGTGHYAFRRGNYQVLPNDNIFMGWSEQATQSEHAPDGRLLMEASLSAEWLGSYRSYKFPFVGRPTTPPDAAAFVTTTTNGIETLIYTSWNGATDIATWNVYSTDAAGQEKTFITEARRTGFESNIRCASFAEYLVVEAVDKDAIVLGESGVIKAKLADDANLTMIALEVSGFQGGLGNGDHDPMAARLWVLVAIAVVGYVGLAVLALFQGRRFSTKCRLASWASFRGQRYQNVPEEAEESSGGASGHREPLLSSSEKD